VKPVFIINDGLTMQCHHVSAIIGFRIGFEPKKGFENYPKPSLYFLS
jgi:hypothetical protein